MLHIVCKHYRSCGIQSTSTTSNSPVGFKGDSSPHTKPTMVLWVGGILSVPTVLTIPSRHRWYAQVHIVQWWSCTSCIEQWGHHWTEQSHMIEPLAANLRMRYKPMHIIAHEVQKEVQCNFSLLILRLWVKVWPEKTPSVGIEPLTFQFHSHRARLFYHWVWSLHLKMCL